MRVLVVIGYSPTQRFVVRLLTKGLIKEVRDLIHSGKHSQAMAKVVSKGSFERKVSEEELPTVEADLILSKNSARWDLVK